MKKGGFLKGKKLGSEGEPTAETIKAMHRELLGQSTDASAEVQEAPPAPEVPEAKPAKAVKVKAVKKPKPKKETKVRITVDMPEGLHEALKIYTIRKRTTIKDIFLAHIEKLVRKEG